MTVKGSALVSAAAMASAVAVACARPGSPGGGPPDQRPPVVIATSPAPGTLVESPDIAIELRFSERISEQIASGTLEDAVLLSPRTGAVRVDHNGDALRVSVEGGLRPGLIYRVTVLPVFADLFRNQMSEPFELAFSTGPELIENALAGQVLDRITGRPVRDANLALLPGSPVADTVPHVARSDADGLFYFRYVPDGPYRLVAFQDRNRDFALDPTEPQGDKEVQINAGDTLITDVMVLDPDTTPARLVAVQVADSSLLRLSFDDYLAADDAGAAVSLEALEGRSAPSVIRLLQPAGWAAMLDSLASTADSAATEPAQEGGAPPPDSTPSPAAQERAGLPGGLPLPSRELMAPLDRPLAPEEPYQVTVTGVMNINGVASGGGQDTIVRAPPAAPTPESAPDSLDAGPEPEARPDSIGVPVDSLGAAGEPRERGLLGRARRTVPAFRGSGL